MAGEINKLIPLYGELNRIYNDWITNYAFSFDKQKFITDFYRQHNDTKAFESAILELVLDKQMAVFVIFGVVACAITSGDTAFRSARLIVAAFMGVEQRRCV